MRPGHLRPRRAGLVVALLLVVLVPARQEAAHGATIPWRLSGADRFATAAAVSAATADPGVPVVYVATGSDYADALAAGPVAAAAHAPTLLVARNLLPEPTATELTRLRPGRIVVVGGSDAVSDQVVDALRGHTNGTVTRIAGRDRFATAAELSRSAFAAGTADVFVATGTNFPDALTGGAAAAGVGAPILLVTPDAVPAATDDEIARLRPSRILVLGGTNAVSDDVVDQLARTGATVRRVAGHDRYATGVAVSREVFPGGTDTVYLATGLAFPDAVTGGPAAAGDGAPLLLVPGGCVPEVVAGEVARLDPRTLVLLGGTAAVAPGVEHLRSCPPSAGLWPHTFDDGAGSWDLESPSWSLAPDRGGNALQGQGHGFARLADWSGAPSRVGFRLRLDRGHVHANVHESFGDAHNRYLVSFGQGGIGISRGDEHGLVTLGDVAVPFSLGVDHDIDLYVGGGSIDVFVDGVGKVGVDLGSTLPAGTVSFETLDDSAATVDDVTVNVDPESAPHPRAPRPVSAIPPGPDVGPFVDGQHTGDFTLAGTDELVLGQGRYVVREGEIWLEDSARLRIEAGAVLVFDRGSSPLYHWAIHALHSSRLEVIGGHIASAGGALPVLHAHDQASVTIRDAHPRLHVAQALGSAAVLVENSTLVSSIGGGFGVGDRASLDVVDAEIGYVSLFVPAGASFGASGLHTGYVQDFDLRRDASVSGIDYDVRIRNSRLTEDTLGEGPYERGWQFSVDESATFDLTDSTIRKLILEMPAGGPDVSFSGLRVQRPSDFSHAGVRLDDVTVTGQWGFFIHGDRRAVFDDCRGLWFFVHDTVDLVLRHSSMNEWDPRDYSGTVTFDDVTWTVAGEIITNNDYVMTGTVEIGPELQQSLSWESSRVTRRLPVHVRDAAGNPIPGATVTATRGATTVSGTTDGQGRTELTLLFTDSDWRTDWTVTTDRGHPSQAVDFLTSSPIVFG